MTYRFSSYCLSTALLCVAILASVFPPSPFPSPAVFSAQAASLWYDIVYVRAPRDGDALLTGLPEVKDPIRMEAGTDLMLLHPDGTEEVLVESGLGAILDPVVSFDAQTVYYAKVHDQTDLHSFRDAARSGADIFKIDLGTREVTQLTFQEWTPNTGAADWSDHPVQVSAPGKKTLGYGVYNLGPCPLPDGKLMFTSSRNAYLPNKTFTFPNLQLYVMNADGHNVEQIGHLNLGSALHPTVLKDGRVMFSSYEARGLRDRRTWGLWAILPDGRHWEPSLSAFSAPDAWHWQTQLSDGSIVAEAYYNQNNNGFGSFVKFPASVPPGMLPFGSPDPQHESNPDIQMGWFNTGSPRFKQLPFSPYGLEGLTLFANENDLPAPFLAGTGAERVGKVTQPSGAPNNDLLLVWTPGAANHKSPIMTPVYDAGLYILSGGTAIDDPSNLILIKNDPAYNEQQPRAVVPYQDIYGIPKPAQLSWLPNDGSTHVELPAGTPYGLVGSSSFYRRNTKPGEGSPEYDGLDAFNLGFYPALTHVFFCARISRG